MINIKFKNLNTFGALVIKGSIKCNQIMIPELLLFLSFGKQICLLFVSYCSDEQILDILHRDMSMWRETNFISRYVNMERVDIVVYI